MAVRSKRSQTIVFSGDVTGTELTSAADNVTSPGQLEVKNLASGANTISVPGIQPTAVTIIPPAANAVTMTLKGVTGDTGIALHLTDPTTIALASSVTSFVITAGNTLNGLRLIWS